MTDYACSESSDQKVLPCELAVRGDHGPLEVGEICAIVVEVAEERRFGRRDDSRGDALSATVLLIVQHLSHMKLRHEGRFEL